jgi:ribonuclease BN (tRNA processing enzyme)
MPLEAGGVRVTPFEVSHPSGAPSYALRFEVAGKVLAFSGDTEWVETLIPTANGADLFITECYAFDKPSRYHMAWRQIEANIERLAARRILLTHMNADMLANQEAVRHPGVLIAEDGMQVSI